MIEGTKKGELITEKLICCDPFFNPLAPGLLTSM